MTHTKRSDKKFKILAWCDSPVAATGFGTVSRHILRHLYKTGKYDIDVLAINHNDPFYDKEAYPYRLVSARLDNPRDPYGNNMLLKNLMEKDYDFLFILNDTFVVQQAAEKIEQIKQEKISRGQTPFKIIFYYPVDCTVVKDFSDMIQIADQSVCMTEFGRQETLKKLPDLNKNIEVIYHGSDLQNFYPVNNAERQKWRKQYLGADTDTFIWINVNRNSVRKDMARTIAAFKGFKEKVPNSLLYMHCAAQDNNIDLIQACKDLGLSNKKDVIFPGNFELHKGGFPIKALNYFYNAADGFVSTTLGEGWGLTTTEAMSTNLPVLLPNNTSAPEILGGDGVRGYMYECSDITWIDNSGYRPVAHTDTITNKMLELYDDNNTTKQKNIISQAKKWLNEHTWENECQKWVKLFERLSKQDDYKQKHKVLLEDI